MRKLDILFARFPYGGLTADQVTDWMVVNVETAKKHPAISNVFKMSVNDTPITMTRNRVLKAALDRKIDIVLMIDSDMQPDLPGLGALPFFPTALDFMLGYSGPCCVAAPYCGPPPHENCYVFQWANCESGHPNADLRLEQFTREEASRRGGFEQVAALPTGLIMIDMRALDALQPPWFEYEYSDPPFNTMKATTEDVFFTRNLGLAGVPQYVLWDSWAGHLKTKCVSKPVLLSSDSVRQEFREALLNNRVSREQLRMIDEGRPPAPVSPVHNGYVGMDLLHAHHQFALSNSPHPFSSALETKGLQVPEECLANGSAK